MADTNPLAETRCRLCGDGLAKIAYTEDTRRFDVKCEKCGAYQVEVAGYKVSLTELNDAKRDEMRAWVAAQHQKGVAVPIITAERLKLLIGDEAPPSPPQSHAASA